MIFSPVHTWTQKPLAKQELNTARDAVLAAVLAAVPGGDIKVRRIGAHGRHLERVALGSRREGSFKWALMSLQS